MKYLYLIIIIAYMISCNKESIEFTGKDGVYFQMQPKTLTGFGDPETWPYSDKTDVPFGQILSNDTTIILKVKLMGKVVDHGRKFGIKIDTANTAVAGEDYDDFGQTFILPAGEEFTLIPIKFHRKTHLQDENRKLNIKLVESNDLIIALDTWHSLGQQAREDTVRVDVHSFIISDILFKPNSWNDYQAGKFTFAKYKLMLELFNLKPSDFDKTKMSNTRFKSILFALKGYLKQREMEGKPVYETDRKGHIIYKKDKNGEFILDEEGKKIPIKMTLGASI